MTTRITAVDHHEAKGKAKELLDLAQSKLGRVPNLLKTMAHSPAVLGGYMALNESLSKGVLPAKVREQLALTVSQANDCEYCLSAHSLIGKLSGLKPEEIVAARHGESDDPKTQALLDLALQVREYHGEISDDQLQSAREAGLSDAEITEVVGHVALNTLTNFFNNVAHTEVDWPRVAVTV